MSRLFPVGMGLLALLLTGCAHKQANFDYDPAFSYAGFHSYAVQQSNKQTYQSLDGSRIEEAIKQQLASRYQLVETSQADFVLHYYVLAEQTVDNSGVSLGFGFGVSNNVAMGVGTRPEARTRTEGKLVLEAVDRASNKLIWTAKATRNLTDNMKPETRAELIREVVQAMLANFPPQ